MESYTKKESGVSTLFFIFTYTFQLEFVLIPIKAVKRFSEFLPLESYSHLQSLEDEILYHILFIFKTYFNFKFNFFIFSIINLYLQYSLDILQFLRNSGHYLDLV